MYSNVAVNLSLEVYISENEPTVPGETETKTMDYSENYSSRMLSYLALNSCTVDAI